MGLMIGNNYNSLNYSISTYTKKNKSVTSQEESSSDSINKEKSPHLCTIPMKFVEEGNSGVYEGYVGGIKMDEKFMGVLEMWQEDSSNSTQIISRINKLYDKTDAEKLEEIFRL